VQADYKTKKEREAPNILAGVLYNSIPEVEVKFTNMYIKKRNIIININITNILINLIPKTFNLIHIIGKVYFRTKISIPTRNDI